MKRLFIILTIITATLQGMHAQVQDNIHFDYPRTLSEYVQNPTPEAASMLRYHDCPVSYATGTANITIPLLQCKLNDIAMNLSISYHTGGIKVDDPVGYPGLGWTLQGLGTVSRQICVMPDESKTFIRHTHRQGFTDDEKIDAFLYKKEANYDRYNYDFPGYSGSFIIDADSIIHFSHNRVKIERIKEASGSDATARFEITTPEGMCYTFAQKEVCKKDNLVSEGIEELFDLSYEATVAWHLTKIEELYSGCCVYIKYFSSDDGKRREEIQTLETITRRWHHDQRYDAYFESPEHKSAVSKAFSHRVRWLPSEIYAFKNRGKIELGWRFVPGQDNTTHICLKSMSLIAAENDTVKRVEFDNAATFADRRPRLDGIRILSEGRIVDARTFTYNSGPANSHQDFFGYSNGKERKQFDKDNILDRKSLTLNPNRSSSTGHVQSWLLNSITEATGVKTVFSYMPARWHDTNNSVLKEVYNGVIVTGITTTDPITGRSRSRSFTYENPQMSVKLYYLSKSDFISLSGVKTYDIENSSSLTSDVWAVYDLSATFTGSSRNTGVPAESMRIYYGKVTETVSGTDIAMPLKTEYRFDNTYAVSPEESRPLMASAAVYSDDMVSTANFSLRLGANLPYLSYLDNRRYNQNDFRMLFGSKPSPVYFIERIDPQPLLVKKIVYDFRNGEYVPSETTENFYSNTQRIVCPVGLYTQSLAYKTFTALDWYEHNLISENTLMMDYRQTEIVSDRVRLDSVATTRHYPDGNSRTITQNLYYDCIPATRDVGLSPRTQYMTSSLDSVSIKEESINPITIKTGYNGDYVMTSTITAEYIDSDLFEAMTNEGRGKWPVRQRWFSKTYQGLDSVDIRYEYRLYNKSFIVPSRRTLTSNGKDIIASEKYLSYVNPKHVCEMQNADGSFAEYYYNTDKSSDEMPLTAFIRKMGSDATDQWTFFDHRPFTGYTSVKFPSGRTVKYTYKSGRLHEVRNTAGNVTASHEYSLYAESGLNMTQTNVHGDKSVYGERTLYDGFGLPVKSILACDDDAVGRIAAYTAYDAIDRPVRQWRPFPTATPDTIPSLLKFNEEASGYYGDSRPFLETEYQVGGTSAKSATYAPGVDLADYPACQEYLCNNSTPELSVRKARMSSNGSSVFYYNNYADGALDAVRTTDEDGHTRIVFTDWKGHKILERRIVTPGEYLDTYYINDQWGKPLVVIPPEMSERFKNLNGPKPLKMDIFATYAFIYKYDRCGRLVYRKLPGCEPVTYRYDPYGREAFMQDGNMRAKGQTRFTLYDVAARPVMTGMCDDTFMADSCETPVMSAAFMAGSSGIFGTGYVFNNELWLANPSLLSAVYYDNYDFLGQTPFRGLQKMAGVYGTPTELSTGSLNAVLGAQDMPPIASVTYYDKEERPGQTISTTLIHGTLENHMTIYTKDGKPKETINSRISDYEETVDVRKYSYDGYGRLKDVEAKFPRQDDFMNIASCRYTSTGLLSEMTNGDLTTEYGYDIRGSLRYIMNDRIRQSIGYNANGSVSGMMTDWFERTFTYDGAGRLVEDKRDNGGSMGGLFSSSYTYDRNSNITSIWRRGYTSSSPYPPVPVDDLTMTYKGNRLTKVHDAADEVLYENSYDFNDGADVDVEYEYDDNGNVILDVNRNIVSIEYNCLNLPSRINIKGNRSLVYVYDASGRKLARWLIEADNATEEYEPNPSQSIAATSFIFNPADPEGVVDSRYYLGDCEFIGSALFRVNTPYGYYYNQAFHPYVRDWQGNIRNDRDYYPYGLPTSVSSIPESDSYGFSGKEFEQFRGLNLYDFEARTYVPDEARFWQPDPMADNYPGISPYAYCAGDPINFIDTDGNEVKCLSKDINLKKFANAYPDNGNIIVFTHGNPEEIRYDIHCKDYKIKKAGDFVTALLMEFDAVESTSIYTDPITIELHSCSTGLIDDNCSDPIAKKISEELKNAVIVAPNGFLDCDLITGEEKVYREKEKAGTDPNGNQLYKGKNQVTPEWRFFHKGNEIDANTAVLMMFMLRFEHYMEKSDLTKFLQWNKTKNVEGAAVKFGF